jgi:hypothetical protein
MAGVVSRIAPRVFSILLTCILFIANERAAASESSNQSPTSAPATAPATQPHIVEVRPHLRINWTDREVELDGKVVLREGLLELFACSPNTREHESIVCIDARPLHIYQALGLLGLEPGEPARYDLEKERMLAATGVPLKLDVRYRTPGGETRRHPVEDWMRKIRTNEPIDTLPWVFAGSYLLDDGMFAADSEGTVVTVVDFRSALIALANSFSADNAELWTEPMTDRIPPLDTPVTLVISLGPLDIGLDATGRIRLAGKIVTFADVARHLRKSGASTPERKIRLVVHPACPVETSAALRRFLIDMGVSETSIMIHELRRTESENPSSAPARESTSESNGR